MVPVTIMPLAGAGAVAPKGDSNSGGRPRPWPVPHTFSLRCAICALSYVAMGLSGRQDGRMTLFALAEEARAECLPFICKERPRNLFKATPGTSFMLVTALVPERTKGCDRGSHGVKPRGFESHPMY